MRVVTALTGGRVTLVDTALTKMVKSSGELNEGAFHGELGVHVPGDCDGHGSTSPGQQHNDYHKTPEGNCFAGFLNCGISLVDVPDGSGFACIPGVQ
eukprot:SAG31_NODE_4844_length_2910_cov_1.221985_1_plen_97_part_00